MLSVLKQATQQLHDDLETVSYADAILSSKLTLSEYEDLMCKNIAIYNYLEPVLNEKLANSTNEYFHSFQSHRQVDLQKDLNSLNFNCKPHLAIPNLLLNDFTDDKLLGYLYVLEGARLGGKVVLKALRKNIQLSHLTSFHFYEQPNINVRARWMAFIEIANQHLTNPQLKNTIQGAQEMFQFFITVFENSLNNNK